MAASTAGRARVSRPARHGVGATAPRGLIWAIRVGEGVAARAGPQARRAEGVGDLRLLARPRSNASVVPGSSAGRVVAEWGRDQGAAPLRLPRSVGHTPAVRLAMPAPGKGRRHRSAGARAMDARPSLRALGTPRGRGRVGAGHPVMAGSAGTFDVVAPAGPHRRCPRCQWASRRLIRPLAPPSWEHFSTCFAFPGLACRSICWPRGDRRSGRPGPPARSRDVCRRPPRSAGRAPREGQV